MVLCRAADQVGTYAKGWPTHIKAIQSRVTLPSARTPGECNSVGVYHKCYKMQNTSFV